MEINQESGKELPEEFQRFRENLSDRVSFDTEGPCLHGMRTAACLACACYVIDLERTV
jgi:hypothetical protein